MTSPVLYIGFVWTKENDHLNELIRSHTQEGRNFLISVFMIRNLVTKDTWQRTYEQCKNILDQKLGKSLVESICLRICAYFISPVHPELCNLFFCEVMPSQPFPQQVYKDLKDIAFPLRRRWHEVLLWVRFSPCNGKDEPYLLTERSTLLESLSSEGDERPFK